MRYIWPQIMLLTVTQYVLELFGAPAIVFGASCDTNVISYKDYATSRSSDGSFALMI